jgi:hypothetical protein
MRVEEHLVPFKHNVTSQSKRIQLMTPSTEHVTSLTPPPPQGGERSDNPSRANGAKNTKDELTANIGSQSDATPGSDTPLQEVWTTHSVEDSHCGPHDPNRVTPREWAK